MRGEGRNREGEPGSAPFLFSLYDLTMSNEEDKLRSTIKDSNPKDAIGIRKAPLSTLSMPVCFEVGAGMLEGACKYGRHNYRVIGVRSSVYYDATMRHIGAWWEGQDIDPDSGIHHISKAIASLFVLRDAMIQGKCFDDRPPSPPADWLKNVQATVDQILARYPEPKAPYIKDP